MTGAVVATVALFALAGAASAEAAVYSGSANDGTKVTIETSVGGQPIRVDFGDYASNCTNHWTNTNPITGFEKPFDDRATDHFADRGKVNVKRHVRHIDGLVDVKAKWDFSASLTDSNRWRGRMSTTGVFSQDGEKLSKCVADFRFSVGPK